MAVIWDQNINFASSLLLHSCLTVVLKETINVARLCYRLALRALRASARSSSPRPCDHYYHHGSVVLDAYTSILSHDRDAELAELYFTNTGFILLGVSLATSIAMNLLLSDLILNVFVAATFGLAWLASLASTRRGYTMPILALRRAGRFIWSDTPFVNFFSLIYIATVLRGQTQIRLQDYITFRAIAVFELVFMKAKLAASSPDVQVELMKRLIASEWVPVPSILSAVKGRSSSTTANSRRRSFREDSFAVAERHKMVAFCTQQRLSVMLLMTGLGYDQGCLQGTDGPASCPLPEVGTYNDETARDWKIFRYTDDVALIVDCFEQSASGASSWWLRFLKSAHGVLLRRLGKVRVIYLVRTAQAESTASLSAWHSNFNLVTGVSRAWLENDFTLAPHDKWCIVAATEWLRT